MHPKIINRIQNANYIVILVDISNFFIYIEVLLVFILLVFFYLFLRVRLCACTYFFFACLYMCARTYLVFPNFLILFFFSFLIFLFRVCISNSYFLNLLVFGSCIAFVFAVLIVIRVSRIWNRRGGFCGSEIHSAREITFGGCSIQFPKHWP